MTLTRQSDMLYFLCFKFIIILRGHCSLSITPKGVYPMAVYLEKAGVPFPRAQSKPC
jgi:hypothetical protein